MRPIYWPNYLSLDGSSRSVSTISILIPQVLFKVDKRKMRKTKLPRESAKKLGSLVCS
jgi:hypothetical protein